MVGSLVEDRRAEKKKKRKKEKKIDKVYPRSSNGGNFPTPQRQPSSPAAERGGKRRGREAISDKRFRFGIHLLSLRQGKLYVPCEGTKRRKTPLVRGPKRERSLCLARPVDVQEKGELK